MGRGKPGMPLLTVRNRPSQKCNIGRTVKHTKQIIVYICKDNFLKWDY